MRRKIGIGLIIIVAIAIGMIIYKLSVEKTISLERLLNDLPKRKSWKAQHVKIWLSNPVIIIKKEGMSIHAWPRSENDFHVPMIRINSGDTLYEVTQKEYIYLKKNGIKNRDKD